MLTDKDFTPVRFKYQQALLENVEKRIEKLKKDYLRTFTAIANVDDPRRRAVLWSNFHLFTGQYTKAFHTEFERYILESMAYTTIRLISLREMPAGMSKPKSVDSPDLDWFLANMDSLIERYNDDWIAIVGRRVVANASTAKNLREILKKENIKGPFVTRASYKAWGV